MLSGYLLYRYRGIDFGIRFFVVDQQLENTALEADVNDVNVALELSAN